MRLSFALIFALFCAEAFGAIIVDTVPVGDLGNPSDPADGDQITDGVQNFGTVNYEYNIGTYEVTVAQYTAFLNAVGATDPRGLWDPQMASDLNFAGIARAGASGSFTYSVIGSPNHPVTYVSWGDAARFANWMHNGQPTGPQNINTTEDGAYSLLGATTAPALNAVSRNVNAKWFIPSEDEWYKAAFYQPAANGGDADNYWNYPMRTNSVPFSDQPPGSTPDNARVANYFQDDGVANGYDDGFAVSGTTTYSSTQNYLTDVGAYTSSQTYYGNFDMGGNVMEWNESVIAVQRGQRGSSATSNIDGLPATYRGNAFPVDGYADVGFRVARLPVPEPSSLLLLSAAFAVLPMARRKSVRRNRV